MSKINWAHLVVFGIVALLVFLIGANLLGGYAGWSMMGPGMMGSGGGNWGFGLGLIFMWLFPLGLLALLVLGIIWLVQQVSRPAGQSPVRRQLRQGDLALTVADRRRPTGESVRTVVRR
jgi:hypothetical protein